MIANDTGNGPRQAQLAEGPARSATSTGVLDRIYGEIYGHRDAEPSQQDDGNDSRD